MPEPGIPTYSTNAGRCEYCYREKNIFVTDDDEEIAYCPTCSDIKPNNLGSSTEHECQVCSEIRTDCVGHHASYDPEQVMPVCLPCHARLHANSNFANEFTPELSRSEAEERDLISIYGLDESWQVE